MPRSHAAMVAAVLALASHITVAGFDRSTAATDNAWLIVVDDLHIDFVHTGRLRTLLRAVVSKLVLDGDLYELLATGPSKSTPQTTASDLLELAIRSMIGNSLKFVDTLGTVAGSSAEYEVALSREHRARRCTRRDGGLRRRRRQS